MKIQSTLRIYLRMNSAAASNIERNKKEEKDRGKEVCIYAPVRFPSMFLL